MKKYIKVFALIVIVCLICSSLTGCAFIDEMRDKRAYTDSKGNIVLSDGTKYVPISIPDNFEIEFDYEEKNEVSVAEKEIPLLLIGIYGKNYYKSNNGGIFLRSDNYSLEGKMEYYCLSDKLLEAELAISDYQIKGYCYWKYNELTYEYAYHDFTAEQEKVINNVLAVAPYNLNRENHKEEYTDQIPIYSYCEQNILRRYEFDICCIDGVYGIASNGLFYEADDKYEEVLKALLKFKN